jgi:8-oxo-dGTP pyrophosphatase MutT (NUDIX family)
MLQSNPPSSGRERLVDAAVRVAYWLAFRLLRLWWYLRRPDHRGAVVAVWDGELILVLRQSYRKTLHFPGGSIERDETPRHAARRELQEELGITVPEEALSLAQETVACWDYRQDHVWIFELKLSDLPTLRPDNREIVEARFMAPEVVLGLDVSPFVRSYLEAAIRPR